MKKLKYYNASTDIVDSILNGKTVTVARMTNTSGDGDTEHRKYLHTFTVKLHKVFRDVVQISGSM